MAAIKKIRDGGVEKPAKPFEAGPHRFVPEKYKEAKPFEAGPHKFAAEKKPNPIPRLVPFLIAAAVIAVGVLGGLKVIHIPYLSDAVDNMDITEISPGAVVNKYSSYEFSSLAEALDPDGSRKPYTYYLGANVGFPPIGMILGPDGVLKGTPSVVGTSTFQVCVRDVGGKSLCAKYRLIVTEKEVVNPDDNPPGPGPDGCSMKNPGCGTMSGTATIQGTFVISSCPCPDGTKEEADLGETYYCACV